MPSLPLLLSTEPQLSLRGPEGQHGPKARPLVWDWALGRAVGEPLCCTGGAVEEGLCTLYLCCSASRAEPLGYLRFLCLLHICVGVVSSPEPLAAGAAGGLANRAALGLGEVQTSRSACQVGGRGGSGDGGKSNPPAGAGSSCAQPGPRHWAWAKRGHEEPRR